MVSQNDAALLFSLEKSSTENKYTLPDHKEVLTLELTAIDSSYKTEVFNLDIR